MVEVHVAHTNPLPRPMRADARRNFVRLVAVAHEVFIEQGIGASLEEIARRAEVGVGTLYRHFPTREALVATVMGSALEAQHVYAQELLELDDPADALDRYIWYWLRNTAVYKGLAAECMKAAVDGEESALTTTCRWAKIDSDALLRRAQAAGQIRSDVTIVDVFRLMHGVAMAVKDTQIDQETTRTLVDVILKGLRTDR